MDLQPGSNVLHYRIVDKLGEGGMGVVWKALDTTLDREVAIKVLPATLAADTERLARFDREAKLLASLNHSHIAGVYGLQEHEGTRFIAMELVPGEDLAEVLGRGALSIERTVELGRQIATGLEIAHEQGVIHRDLKPANVKLTPDGEIKILDFGLAKAFEPDPTASGTSATMSPTMTSAGSMVGVILGTAAYMSPQQARGHVVDKRADVFSFGCLLFEMLTGRLAFPGDTVSDTLAAVLKLEPDWDALPASLPPALETLLRRCLEKDARKRLRDIGEARILMEGIAAGDEIAVSGRPADPGPDTGSSSRLPWILAGVAGVVAIVALLAPLLLKQPTEAPPPKRLRVQLGDSLPDPEQNFSGATAVLSPDGERIAYITGQPRQIFIRRMNEFESLALAGTEGASQPFFSPDGEWVGFFQDGEMRRISVLGGAAVKICNVRRHRGATWLPDGRIVFSAHTAVGLSIVSSAGGEPQPLTSVDVGGVRSHRWPHALPDGKRVLFTEQPGGVSFDQANVSLVDLESGETRVLLSGGASPRYVPTGHIVYVHTGTLFAVPVDTTTLEPNGPAFPVVEDVVYDSRNGGARFDFSPQGHLLYTRGESSFASNHIAWIGRDGSQERILEEVRDYNTPRLSPDETRLAFSHSGTGGQRDVWVHDLSRNATTRLTFNDLMDSTPVWHPDGTRLAYASLQDASVPNLFWTLADGSGEPERLTHSMVAQFPSAFTPDGKGLLYKQETSQGWSLNLLDLETRESTVFLESDYSQSNGELSPDGRFVAYDSNESGDFQVYVRPFPSGPGKWLLSTGYSGNPVWSKDGNTVYFLAGPTLYSVAVDRSGGTIRFDSPQPVSDAAVFPTAGFARNYDLTSDGRIVSISSKGIEAVEEKPNEDRLILNWFEELRRGGR